MKTFKDIIPNLRAGETWWLLKPTGTTYIREKNGECARTKDRNLALAFASEKAAEAFVGAAGVDDRNDRAFGARLGMVPVAIKPPTAR